MSREGLVVRNEQEIVEIVERVLQARRVEQSGVSQQELQKAMLDIRDAIRLQAQAVVELTRTIQTATSRGAGGGAGGF